MILSARRMRNNGRLCDKCSEHIIGRRICVCAGVRGEQVDIFNFCDKCADTPEIQLKIAKLKTKSANSAEFS